MRFAAITVFLAASLIGTQAEGGIAELKALTGDAPYLGFGNQEQAPEFFGSALTRQYYRDPISYSSSYNPYSMHYGYRNPYRSYGHYPASTYQMPAMPAIAVASPVGSGFYTGAGNDWVKK